MACADPTQKIGTCPRDRHWMLRALALAKRGLGNTVPNPLVGAIVLDSNHKLVGSGFHQKAGEPHAEVLALNAAGEKARQGTLYVSLEPCCHFGRTPPCTDRILQSGVKRVVIATTDPNPLVNGKGIETLLHAGIEVFSGCLKEKADALNAPFRTWITQKRPFVTAKVAISLDGKIGTRGTRTILSGPTCEKTTMRLRAEAQAIVVGANTVISDDPRLTVRGQYQDRKPIRVILDGHLRTPSCAKMFHEQGGAIWIICNEDKASSEAADLLKKSGAKIVPFKTSTDGRISILEITHFLGKEGISSLLIEGGSQLLSQFAQVALVDRWVLYLVPQILGESFQEYKAVPLGIPPPFSFKIQSVIRRGGDIEVWAV